jgi:hypothetical protein
VQVDSASAVSGAPALAVEPSGRVHVVWPDARQGGRALRTRAREPGGAWGLETRLTPPAFAADEPSLDAAADGTLHLVWHDGRSSLFSPEVLHRAKAPGAAWDTTTANDFPVSGPLHGAVRPSVLAHGEEVLVLWRDARSGNNEIHFRRGGPAGTGAPQVAAAGPTPAALRAFPNPTRGSVRFARADGRPPGPLEVATPAGRIVRRLAAGSAWDGRDGGGATVAAGVYFIRSRDAGVTRVTVLR